MQDITVGSMLWGDCGCLGYGLGKAAMLSRTYIHRIDCLGQPVLKLGYSACPAKRLWHKPGIKKGSATEVLRFVNLLAEQDARAEEKSADRILATQCSDKVIDNS